MGVLCPNKRSTGNDDTKKFTNYYSHFLEQKLTNSENKICFTDTETLQPCVLPIGLEVKTFI